MIQAYARWVLRWRLLVIFGSLVLVGLAGSGITQLQFTTDFRMFFGNENPQLALFDTLEATYSKNDNLLFVLAPTDGQVFTPRGLAAVERLTQAAWQLPYSRRVDSITNFQHVSAEGDDLQVRDLVRDAERLDAAGVDRVRDIALREPLIVNRLVAPSGQVTGVNVRLQLPEGGKAKVVPEVARQARSIADSLRVEFPDIDVYITGGVMMDNAFGESSEHDLKTLIPLMIGILMVVLGILLGTYLGTIVILMVLALSILTAMGVAGWLGIAISPSSAIAPNIIMTCALADCVHVLARFYQNMRAQLGKPAAITESLAHSLHPMFLTGITTAIGFLSMNASEVPVFRDLGNIAAVGVVAAFMLSVTLLPASVAMLPVRVRPRKDQWLDRLWAVWPDWVLRWHRPLFWGTSAVAMGLMLCIPRNELNDEFVKYFDETTEFRQATDFAIDHLTGFYYIDYSLPANDGSITDTEYLNAVDGFANWYRSQPETMHVYAITDVFKVLNRVMHGDAPEWYRTPETPELAAQYLLIYEMSLPYGLDLNDRISVDKKASRLSVTLRNLSSNQLLALERRAQEWLAEHTPSLRPATGGGMTMMFAHIGKRNIESMLWGTFIAQALITIILVVVVRSLRIGLISIVPNVIPAAIAFGVWGLTVGQVGMSLSVVASMTLGIVVDDTVHFLTHFLEARNRRGLDVRGAIKYAMSAAGPASLVMGIVLMTGFSVLAFSNFAVNSGLGLLTAMAIAVATIVEFLLLPPLLLRAANTGNKAPLQLVTTRAVHDNT